MRVHPWPYADDPLPETVPIDLRPRFADTTECSETITWFCADVLGGGRFDFVPEDRCFTGLWFGSTMAGD